MLDDQTSAPPPLPPIAAPHVHNLVRPLTVAKGNLQLVRRHLLHPDGSKIDAALRSLETAERHIDHTARVIHDHAGPEDGSGAPTT